MNNEETIAKLVNFYGDSSIVPSADQWRNALAHSRGQKICMVNFMKFREQADYPDEEDVSGSVKVSDLKQRFYTHVPKIKRLVLDLLTSPPKLFTARPGRVQGAWVGIGFLVGFLCVGLGIIATAWGIGNPVARWVSVAAVPIVVIGFGLAMPARTLKGTWLLNHVLGLREYIDRVDRDHLTGTGVGRALNGVDADATTTHHDDGLSGLDSG